MKVLALICRILLGAIFVFFGANILHPFLPVPKTAMPPLLMDFMHVMMDSGWMKVIGLFQVLGGVLALFGGTLPLGLCILCPLTVNILCVHSFLMGGHGIGPGVLTAVLEIVLIYAYRGSFTGVLSASQRPTA